MALERERAERGDFPNPPSENFLHFCRAAPVGNAYMPGYKRQSENVIWWSAPMVFIDYPVTCP